MLGATVQNLAARATRLLGFVNPCFIEPENSLPYSQHPAICSYSEPDQPRRQSPILCL